MANLSLLVDECSSGETSTCPVRDRCVSSFLIIVSSLFLSSLYSRKLFYANEIFQGILIHTKAMCEVYYFGQKDRVQPLCLLDRYAYLKTLTLAEFSQRQTAQMDTTLMKLKDFLDHIADLAAKACQVNTGQFTDTEKFTLLRFRKQWNWKESRSRHWRIPICTGEQWKRKKQRKVPNRFWNPNRIEPLRCAI